VVIPKRRAVGLTGTVSKTSAGAINHIAVTRVTNVSAAVLEIKKHGIWVVCADAKGKSMYKSDLTGPLAIVLGAENEGVSLLVKKNSDFTVSIPMIGKIASLNVSVAAGVLIYDVIRQRIGR
jgi:23S rRNA (guanosine2251-2'-O)-methyltransferase